MGVGRSGHPVGLGRGLGEFRVFGARSGPKASTAVEPTGVVCTKISRRTDLLTAEHSRGVPSGGTVPVLPGPPRRSPSLLTLPWGTPPVPLSVPAGSCRQYSVPDTGLSLVPQTETVGVRRRPVECLGEIRTRVETHIGLGECPPTLLK